ncbi:MAG: hypothetical protein V4760_09740 [Bdellovibrionota bacterium]
MNSSIERKTKIAFGLLAAAVFVMAFQNCGTPIDFTRLESKANGNGTGYDGKIYVNHGKCGTAVDIALKGAIAVDKDGTANVIRQDCTDLAAPIPIAAGSLLTAMTDSNVKIYETDIYDYFHADPNQRKLTKTLCWMNPLSLTEKTEVLVWYRGDAVALSNTSPTLSGRVKSLTGTTTGVMSPVGEQFLSPTNVEYASYDQSGNGFTLRLFVNTALGGTNYANMQYKVGGIASPQTVSTDCYTQGFP